MRVPIEVSDGEAPGIGKTGVLAAHLKTARAIPEQSAHRVSSVVGYCQVGKRVVIEIGRCDTDSPISGGNIGRQLKGRIAVVKQNTYIIVIIVRGDEIKVGVVIKVAGSDEMRSRSH